MQVGTRRMLIGTRNDNVKRVRRRPPTPPPLERDDCIIVPGLSRKVTTPHACIKGCCHSAQNSIHEARGIVVPNENNNTNFEAGRVMLHSIRAQPFRVRMECNALHVVCQVGAGEELMTMAMPRRLLWLDGCWDVYSRRGTDLCARGTFG